MAIDNRMTVYDTLKRSCARHSKPRLTPHCRVLPPGELNSMIPISLLIFRESFMTTVATVLPRCCHGNKHNRVAGNVHNYMN